MSISETCIKRPAMTGILAIAVIVFGLLSLFKLPVSDLPDVEVPTIEVTTYYDGFNAEAMATYIGLPLETEFLAIPGIQDIQTMNVSGMSLSVLVFDLDVSLAEAEAETQKAIQTASQYLPSDMPQQPTYEVYNPSSQPIMFLAVNSKSTTEADLYRYADSVLADNIYLVDGVGNINYFGTDKAIRVKVNPLSLAQRNLSLSDVVTSVTNASSGLPGGKVYTSSKSYEFHVEGQIKEAKDYENIIVGRDGTAPVLLKDIGRAYDSVRYENFACENWYKGGESMSSVVLAIYKQPGANTVQIVDDIEKLFPTIEASLPPSVSLESVFTYKRAIMDSVNEVRDTLLIAFGLVVLVVFLFLGRISATIIPCLALPFSIIGSMIFMKTMGFSINVLTLLGYVLIIGFLVDDAIVMLENIFRHLEKGKKPYQAAVDGSREVVSTIISMSSSLIAVFIPLAFLPGVIGKTFFQFAMIVMLTVGLSGFVAITLIPMLCSRYLKVSGVSKVEELSKKFLGRIEKIYEPILGMVLRHRFKTVLCGVISFIVSLFIYDQIPKDFLPAGDTGSIMGMGVANPSIGPKEIVKLQSQANDIAKSLPYVDRVISGANMAITAPNQTRFFVHLSPDMKRPTTTEVINILRGKTAGLVGFLPLYMQIPPLNLNNSPQTGTGDYQYVIKTLGDPEELYKAADELLGELRKIPAINQITSNTQTTKPMYRVHINRELASYYGITALDINQAISYAFSDGRINTYNTNIDIQNVVFSLEEEFMQYPEDLLDNVFLPSVITSSQGQNTMIPLRAIVDLEEYAGPAAVFHHGKLNSVTLSFDVASGYSLSQATALIDQAASKVISGSEFMAGFEGQALVFSDVMTTLAWMLLLAIFVVYVILTVLYESYIHPFTILSTLPGVTFGTLFSLWITGQTLSLYSYIGIFVVLGIVLKNGIIIVDFANVHIREGLKPVEAVMRASTERFRPILMTTIAAGMGALPIALGMGARSEISLGIAIVGGLIISQLVTLFVTPCVYVYFEELQEWSKKRKNSQSAAS